ncbi:hypothetical protein [Pararhodobacter zhoushanensis]|uniref:hypothetical protein n=1 Tax=Pararhodobacter zhoushanensis TaxID=2479545 RepID=UPI000F8D8D68|nr:hypothetical protein [Pararhodobacter zhoushanensis]
MSRDMTAAAIAAIARSETPRLALFVEGQFESGALRLWSGLGPISWGGHEWTGAGQLLAVSPIEESNGVVAQGLTVALSGVPLDLVQIAIDEARQGDSGNVWLGMFEETGALIADPVFLFGGLLDVPQIDEGDDSCTISISYENQLIDLQRPRVRRYTHEDQQVKHPGDLGFEFVTTIQNQEDTWGE